MGNPLVAEAEGPKGTDGAGLVGDIASLTQDHDAWDYTVDGVSAGLDTLGMVMDPFGAIASAGVGWLLQHVEFLREPIDKLTGDPSQITAIETTWHNIAERLHECAADYANSVQNVSAWNGHAADDYRHAANDYIDVLNATGDHADHAAEGIMCAGILVGTERGLVYDALSGFIGRLVIEAIAALASSWCTFGASIGAFLVAADLDATIQAESFALRIGKLMQALGKFAQKFGRMSQRAEELGRDIARAGGKLRQVAGRNKGLKTIAHNRYRPPNSAVEKFLHGEHGLHHSLLGNVHEATEDWRAKPVKETVKQIDEAHKHAEEESHP
ncbi:MAG TPA: PPE domain-containing protein [Jatrophihabitantaceae bacterium]|nr:PPE domain-containing protein [Jatrophihabitantaceae bacterium]